MCVTIKGGIMWVNGEKMEDEEDIMDTFQIHPRLLLWERYVNTPKDLLQRIQQFGMYPGKTNDEHTFIIFGVE
jgi:hypothetical protein